MENIFSDEQLKQSFALVYEAMKLRGWLEDEKIDEKSGKFPKPTKEGKERLNKLKQIAKDHRLLEGPYLGQAFDISLRSVEEDKLSLQLFPGKVVDQEIKNFWISSTDEVILNGSGIELFVLLRIADRYGI